MKAWLQDFPSTNAAAFVALVLIFATGLTVILRLAFGKIFPDGYDTWTWALVALSGVNVAGMVGKRATDIEYKKAGTSPVSVGGPSDVTVNTGNAPAAPPEVPPRGE